MSRGFARDFAMAAIAMAALDLGGPAGFESLAAEVPDARLRADVLMTGAAKARASGDEAGADRLLALAHEAALTISDPVERSAARARLARFGVGAETWPAVVADAVAIEDPWQRARALVALADIASTATAQ